MRRWNNILLIVILLFILPYQQLSQDRIFSRQEIASDKKNVDWIDYNKLYLKMGVAVDGVYRIYYTDLLSNGFNPDNIDPNKMIIYASGEMIPIYIKGKDDYRFDTDDYIEFVGLRNMGGNHREVSSFNQPYNEYLGRYTDTTIYWLSWREVANSVIDIFQPDDAVPADSILDYYYETIHYERDIALDYSIADIVRKELPYWTENKTWIESLLNTGTKNYKLQADAIYPDRKVSLYAKVQDYASDVFTNPHLITIGINESNFLDSTFIQRYQQALLHAEINSIQLKEGDNTFKIKSLPTNGSINVIAIDWVELEYPRKLKCFNDTLKFSFTNVSGAKNYQIKIENIPGQEFSLWKYGNSNRKFEVDPVGSDIIFSDTIKANDSFIISGNNRIRKPKFYYAKKFTSLKSEENSGEYIIITNKKFMKLARDYCSFISDSYNLHTMAVDVDDIYDHFSYGFFDPGAIRKFLKYAYDYWQSPKVKYLFLVGGATYDYYGNKANYQGAPRLFNYVPSFGSPVSDSWFVIFDSSKTFVPGISIGRIPVTTNEEFEWYFSKHKEYLSQQFNAWNKRVILFSGGTGNDQNQIDALQNVNEFIINNYITPKPYSAQYTHFYKTINPVNNFGHFASSKISNVIDSGGVFISYLGHSGTQTWDNSITDQKQLQNKFDRYPLITDFGCSTARFAEPDVISFSQSFVNVGQAIAYIANSSLGFTSTSYTFPKIFYKKLLKDSVSTIGDAHRLAKKELIEQYGSSVVYQLFLLTNTLIGDPVIKLRIPPKPNLSVSENDIRITGNNISDSRDCMTIKIDFFNYGLSFNTSFKIIIQVYYKNTLNFTKEVIRSIPDYHDSIEVKIPVKGLNGEHKFIVTLDADKMVDEIYEYDNQAVKDLIVPGGTVKFLSPYQFENYFKNPVRILTPGANDAPPSVILEIADNQKFLNSRSQLINLDTIKNDFIIENSLDNKRIWLRTKFNMEDTTGSPISFKLTDKNAFALYDSLSFSSQYLSNLKLGNRLSLDSTFITFKLLSAGLNDGNTALILKDGQNYIPENTLRGHHVALFKGKNYEFNGYKLFDLYDGGSAVANDYIRFLDTLSSDYLVAFAISDEGTVSSSPLRSKIKEFGSRYIDNVSFRSSWVMLGRKGAPVGSVSEKFAKQYQGRVEIDSSILSDFRTGQLSTGFIGSSGKWNKLKLGISGDPDSFRITILGKKDSGMDTLFTSVSRQLVYDLSSIEAVKYPYIKINLHLSSQNIEDAVKVDSLVVDYLKPPELIISRRMTSVSSDTLNQGEVINVKFPIYNVGETTAGNIKVTFDLLKTDGSKIQVYETFIDSIVADAKKYLSIDYDTRLITGPNTFIINIDPLHSQHEIYTDNNYLSVPFFVRADANRPVIQLSFDDVEIFDGDYISSDPDIKIKIFSNSLIPITDTSSVEIYLNEGRICYDKNYHSINYSFSNSNPKMLISYKPVLEDGEYNLKVIAGNPNNSLIEKTVVQKMFKVSMNARLLNVCNYPNPFNGITFFTFKLTQIPDQLKIRVYTLTGRLIKEIIKYPSELHYDFNRIEWDGRDEDGSLIANGVYLYKVIVKKGSDLIIATQKLAVVR